MRTLNYLLIGAVLLAGAACQSAPPAPAPKQAKLDASNIAEAQAAGYRIITKDGKKLYCRKDLVTGSHVRSTTACLTEEQRAALNETSRRSVEEMSRHTPPKQGK